MITTFISLGGLNLLPVGELVHSRTALQFIVLFTCKIIYYITLVEVVYTAVSRQI